MACAFSRSTCDATLAAVSAHFATHAAAGGCCQAEAGIRCNACVAVTCVSLHLRRHIGSPLHRALFGLAVTLHAPPIPFPRQILAQASVVPAIVSQLPRRKVAVLFGQILGTPQGPLGAQPPLGPEDLLLAAAVRALLFLRFRPSFREVSGPDAEPLTCANVQRLRDTRGLGTLVLWDELMG